MTDSVDIRRLLSHFGGGMNKHIRNSVSAGRIHFALLFCTVALLLFSTTAVSEAFKLPDTGQIKCYGAPYYEIPCAGTGQDGAYSINPMSFTDNHNGTVTDNNTGLMWQKCSAGQNNDAACSGGFQGYNWYKARGRFHATYNPSSQNICGDLVLGGHADWRLPFKKELLSIVDYSVPEPGPTIKSAYFPNTWGVAQWTSTTDVYNLDEAWTVVFGYGDVTSFSKDNNYGVRCVRGGPSNFGFVDNQDSTVTDIRTGLMWQQAEPGTKPWQGAIDYCNGLDLANKTDWRLPNIKELESITDSTRYNPAIDTTFFPGASADGYWTSTTDTVPSGYYGSVVFFGTGHVRGYAKFYSQHVRCVRGGQASNLIANPDFKSGTVPWRFYTDGSGNFSVINVSGNNIGRVQIKTAGTNVQLYQAGLMLEADTKYRLTFKADSNTGHDLRVALLKYGSPYTNYGLKKTFNLGTTWQSYSVEFTTSGFSGTVNDGRFMFWLAPYDAAGDEYFFDDVVLEQITAAP